MWKSRMTNNILKGQRREAHSKAAKCRDTDGDGSLLQCDGILGKVVYRHLAAIVLCGNWCKVSGKQADCSNHVVFVIRRRGVIVKSREPQGCIPLCFRARKGAGMN